MRRLKRWFFPALTCLIVIGAAVLPARFSLARDAGQFGQVHAETLDADALSLREPSSLLDRMLLYVGQDSSDHPVLAYLDDFFEDSEALPSAQAAQTLLTENGILPDWFFLEEPFDRVEISRLLLLDPAGEIGGPEPSSFLQIQWTYHSDKNHQKTVFLILDTETGLPIHLNVHDTNMSQWLPYESEDLKALAERFFALLEPQLPQNGIRDGEDNDRTSPFKLDLVYSIDQTDLYFRVLREPTTFTIFLYTR